MQHSVSAIAEEFNLYNLDKEILLHVGGLTRSFGDLVAVRELSFDIRKGEIFGFLGPNGAGKTTTIRMICGLLKKDAGEIHFNSHNLRKSGDFSHLLGLCPQELVIWESLTPLEQLEFMGRLYDLPAQRARKKAVELLEILGLIEKKNKLAGTLSGGMKRRLNIALALIHEPELLILDEPQAGLDPQSRVLVREYIQDLTGKTTIILTTHDMDEAERLAHRVAVIDHGKLLVCDTPGNLKKQLGRGDILEILLDEANEEKITGLIGLLPPGLKDTGCKGNTLSLVGADIPTYLPQVLGLVKKSGMVAGEMTIRKKTLEDVFISLTGRGLRE